MIERIGGGGTSAVWRAHDEVLRRRVAVKLLPAQSNRDGRLEAGAQAAALLNHPNVSAVYDYGVAGDETFVVMEFVDGISLAARLARGPLPWRGAVEVCAYVAAALSAAHARGLVHGGITPADIMLTDTGVKVLDFGIAAVARSRGAGRSPFRAPERLTGPAADVYALGVVLFAALTGQPPQPAGRMAALRDDPEPAPLPLIPGMPLEIAAIYQRCLDTDPTLRPSSASLAHRLAVLAGVRVGAVDVHPLPSPADDETSTDVLAAAPRGRFGPVTLTIAAAALAVAVGVAGVATAFGLSRSIGAATRWTAGSGAPTGTPSTQAGGPGPASSGVGQAPASQCTVSYQVKDTWGNGANVSLTITNAGKTDVKDWALTFDLGGGLQARSGWNGTWQQDGAQVTVMGLAGHPDLPAGSSLSDVGASIDGDHADSIPDGFALNGTPCRAQP